MVFQKFKGNCQYVNDFSLKTQAKFCQNSSKIFWQKMPDLVPKTTGNSCLRQKFIQKKSTFRRWKPTKSGLKSKNSTLIANSRLKNQKTQFENPKTVFENKKTRFFWLSGQGGVEWNYGEKACKFII